MSLRHLLILAAGLQLAIAGLNLFLVPLLHCKTELVRVPLLLREVFQVHAWFISITLVIFAVMTLRFASEMAGGANIPLDWLAGAIGIFWGIRAILQVAYYSSTHWRGRVDRTAIHAALLLVYGGFSFIYLLPLLPLLRH